MQEPVCPLGTIHQIYHNQLLTSEMAVVEEVISEVKSWLRQTYLVIPRRHMVSDTSVA
jgi:hypothetical protein